MLLAAVLVPGRPCSIAGRDQVWFGCLHDQVSIPEVNIGFSYRPFKIGVQARLGIGPDGPGVTKHTEFLRTIDGTGYGPVAGIPVYGGFLGSGTGSPHRFRS